MPPLNKRFVLVGVAKQTAKGAAASTPTYGFGVTDGGPFKIDIDQDREEITSASRIAPDVNRVGMIPGAEFTTRLYQRSSGLWIYAGLGSIVTTPGSPNSHVSSPAVDLPWLTLFGKYDTDYVKLPDCKVNSLGISWEGRAPVEMAIEVLGLVPEFGIAPWTPTNDETGQPKFAPPGGIFRLDANAAVPAVAPVTAGEIIVNNNLQPSELSKSVLPDDLVPGKQEIDFNLTIQPTSFAEHRKIVTGTGTGTTIRETPVSGSADVKFVIDANTDLLLAASRVPFLGDYPEADEGGGPAEIELAGQVVRPSAGGAEFTSTLRNAIASY